MGKGEEFTLLVKKRHVYKTFYLEQHNFTNSSSFIVSIVLLKKSLFCESLLITFIINESLVLIEGS